MAKLPRTPLPPDPPPGASPLMHDVMRRAMRPVESFLHTEVASGILLLVATVGALGWANSPWSASYHALWQTPLGVSFGELVYEQTLGFWINEVLMTLFFFVVGLEVRRELAHGELSDLRRAALPLAAALGGMAIPAAIFLIFNAGTPNAAGWGVPMATDIAFALGALTLLGKRIPPALRVLLLALAVIDDIGAILVIGIFYSSGVKLTGLAIAAGGVVAILLMQRAGLRKPLLYVLPGAIVWEGIHSAGVHATLAGVIVGLLTPDRAWFEPKAVVRAVHGLAEEMAGETEASAAMAPWLDSLGTVRREALSPVDRLVHGLHPWVAFGVMPLFALANAGVTLGAIHLDASALPLMAGIVLGLTVGKLVGITGGSWLAVKAGWAGLPRGVTWRGVAIVGMVGGIGFTMSLFIAELAFEATSLAPAKLAILVGSIIAAVAGLLGGRLTLPANAEVPGMARTESEAEASTQR